MAVPKSVIRINKKGVKYISEADKCQYYIYELCRRALMDVGRFVCKEFNKNFYAHFGKRTGYATKATKYKVYSGKKTMYPRVEIGLKTGKVLGFYAYFQEFGAEGKVKVPRLGLLKKSAQNNIAEIIKIESQYLSALQSEARARAQINERSKEGDANG